MYLIAFSFLFPSVGSCVGYQHYSDWISLGRLDIDAKPN